MPLDEAILGFELSVDDFKIGFKVGLKNKKEGVIGMAR